MLYKYHFAYFLSKNMETSALKPSLFFHKITSRIPKYVQWKIEKLLLEIVLLLKTSLVAKVCHLFQMHWFTSLVHCVCSAF